MNDKIKKVSQMVDGDDVYVVGQLVYGDSRYIPGTPQWSYTSARGKFEKWGDKYIVKVNPGCFPFPPTICYADDPDATAYKNARGEKWIYTSEFEAINDVIHLEKTLGEKQLQDSLYNLEYLESRQHNLSYKLIPIGKGLLNDLYDLSVRATKIIKGEPFSNAEQRDITLAHDITWDWKKYYNGGAVYRVFISDLQKVSEALELMQAYEGYLDGKCILKLVKAQSEVNEILSECQTNLVAQNKN